MASPIQTGLFLAVSILISLCGAGSPNLFNPPPLIKNSQWTPKIDSVTRSYFPESEDRKNSQFSSQPVQQFSAYSHLQNPSSPVVYRRVQNVPVNGQQWPSSSQTHQQLQKNQHFKPSLYNSPEPMPRSDTDFQKKAGLSFLSSLVPTSILNVPQASSSDTQEIQEENSDSDNLIESANTNQNGSPLFNNPFQNQQNPFLQQSANFPSLFSHSASPNFNLGLPSPPPSSFLSHFQNLVPKTNQEEAEDADPEPSDLDTSMESGEGGGGSGVLSKIRNILPLGNGFIAGLLNSTTTTTTESYGYADYNSNGANEEDNSSEQKPALPSLGNLFNFGKGQSSNPNEDDNEVQSQNNSPNLPSFPSLGNLFQFGKGQSTDESSDNQGESMPIVPSLGNLFKFGNGQSTGHDDNQQEDNSQNSPSIPSFGNLFSFGKGQNTDNDNNNPEEESNSPNLPSLPSLGNIFKFGNGQSSTDDDSSVQYGADNTPNLNSLFGRNPVPVIPNIFSIGSGVSSSNLLAPDGNSEAAQGDSYGEEDNENQSDGGLVDGLNFLPSLPNPFQGVKGLFRNLFSAQSSQDDSGYDGLQDPSLPSIGSSTTEEMMVTALQSVVNGGIGGALGPVLRIISKIIDTYSFSVAGFSKLKVAIIILGPILAAALASMIIGIVYISIYVPAWAIRNEALDGDFFIIPINQLIDLLGLPNPLEDLFGFRSLEGRSISEGNESSVTFGISDFRKKAFTNGTVHEKGQCMERFACEIIGRKLLRRNRWKDGFIANGIVSLGGSKTNNRNQIQMTPRHKEYNQSSLNITTKWSSSLRTAKNIIDAVATGLTDDEKDDDDAEERRQRIGKISPCKQYSCDPIKILKAFVINKINTAEVGSLSKSINKTVVAYM